MRFRCAMCHELCDLKDFAFSFTIDDEAVSYTHLRAHETSLHLVCRLLLEKMMRERAWRRPAIGA